MAKKERNGGIHPLKTAIFDASCSAVRTSKRYMISRCSLAGYDKFIQPRSLRNILHKMNRKKYGVVSPLVATKY